MILRKYEAGDSEIICGWIKDSKTLFQWSADRIGKFPLEGNELNENYCRCDEKLFFPLTAVNEAGQIVGHLFIRIPDENDKSVVRFGFVIVSPEMRGKGLGKKMLELASEFARKGLAAKKITLGVFENNPNAYRCYKSVGFTPVGERAVRILSEDWTCIDMELKLE